MEGRYVLKEIHEGCCADHADFWPAMSKDAKEWVKKCEKCQKHDPLIHLPIEEMRAMFSPCPFANWELI